MKVTLDREGKNLVKLDVELDSEQALKAYEQACRQLSHKVNIPGFRRGKTPRNILEKTLGVEYIKREALERLVPELLNKAILNESLDVITEPEVDSCDFNLGEPLKLKAKFEVKPTVTLGDYKGISIEVPEAKLPENALDETLSQLAESRAELKAIPARPVAMDDTVLLDFECYVDDKLLENGKTTGMVLKVKEGSFIPGFCEQLVGKEPGKPFEIKVNFPADYRNKEVAGKEALFKVEIKELREQVQPPVDEELAKNIGFDSIDALKEAITGRLNAELEQENMARKQKYVVEAIVNNSTVDLPETMIERERNLLLEQMKRQTEQMQQSWEELEQSPEFAKIKETKYEEAKKRVLTSLVLGAIVQAEKISASEQELRSYLEEVISHYNLPAQKSLSNSYLQRQVLEEILTTKVVEFIVGEAKITLVPDKDKVPAK